MCVFGCIGLYTWAEAREAAGVQLFIFPSHSLETSPLTKSGDVLQAVMTLWSSSLSTKMLKSQAYNTHTWHFPRVPEIWSQVLTLCSNGSYPPGSLSSTHNYLLINRITHPGWHPVCLCFLNHFLHFCVSILCPLPFLFSIPFMYFWCFLLSMVYGCFTFKRELQSTQHLCHCDRISRSSWWVGLYRVPDMVVHTFDSSIGRPSWPT